MKNLGRNLKATGPMFLLGVILSALFQRYVPSDTMARLKCGMWKWWTGAGKTVL